eukprot:CAMPEP_0176308502 /NCGR_PEP_ID=MMETSP0121_2-20121125/64580_1 /TAXON_ID=160619 /ORGANISM="Kryptoperidinium foliaceum, Strain CCMP 1326" /LENGTH=120 /DNA_ID=CAMNT_0017650343 /DNA_START=75 /DNA_END=434 /DNA_ORIENTATION=-
MTINDFIVQTALLSCGDRLLAFGLSKAVVWDLSTGTRLHELEAYTRTSSAIRIAVATGGDVVAACSESWAFTDRVDPEWSPGTCGRALGTRPRAACCIARRRALRRCASAGRSRRVAWPS